MNHEEEYSMLGCLEKIGLNCNYTQERKRCNKILSLTLVAHWKIGYILILLWDFPSMSWNRIITCYGSPDQTKAVYSLNQPLVEFIAKLVKRTEKKIWNRKRTNWILISVPFQEIGKGDQENSGDGLPVSDKKQMAHSFAQVLLEIYVNNGQSKINSQHYNNWFPLIKAITFSHQPHIPLVSS